MEFLTSFVVLCVNTTHILFYLRPSTRSPLRFFLLYLSQAVLLLGMWWAGKVVPSVSGFIIFFYVLFGIWLLRICVTRDSWNRIFFCVSSVFVCSQIIRSGPFLAASHWLGWTTNDAARASAFFYLAAILLLTPFLFRYIREPFRRILDIAETQKWYLMSLTPILLAFTGGLIHFPVTEVPVERKILIMSIFMPLCSIAYFIFIHVFLIRHQDRLVLAQRLAAAKRLEETYAFYDGELSEKEQRLKRLRHDFRHLVLHLQELARERDLDGILREISAVAATGRQTDIRLFSENRTVNAVIASCFARADELGIHCTAKAYVPENLAISKPDLSMLLGNALENCIKGAATMTPAGYITFSAKPGNGYMMFEFTNNYAPSAYVRGEGVGLASIRHICEEHHGRVEIQDKNGEFRLTLFLLVLC
jgi:signal transduction histidine kinase